MSIYPNTEMSRHSCEYLSMSAGALSSPGTRCGAQAPSQKRSRRASGGRPGVRSTARRLLRCTVRLYSRPNRFPILDLG